MRSITHIIIHSQTIAFNETLLSKSGPKLDITRRMVRNHLWGILNAIMHRATNAIADSINATIQKIKARACGFRNRSRFRTAILFHKGGLSMLPSKVYWRWPTRKSEAPYPLLLARHGRRASWGAGILRSSAFPFYHILHYLGAVLPITPQ